MPAEPFEPGLTLAPRVDRYAQIVVRTCAYSVPVWFIGRRVRVLLRASEVLVFDGGAPIARHARSVVKGGSVLLDHYLQVLIRKPGALAGSTALAKARTSGTFTAAHEAFWAAARARHGDAGGTRALIEVLLHRHMRHADVVAGLLAAGQVGATSADVVAVEARKAADRSRAATPPVAAEDRPPVVSLTQRRLADPAAVIAGLPADRRPPPAVTAYDELLPRRTARARSSKRRKGTAS